MGKLFLIAGKYNKLISLSRLLGGNCNRPIHNIKLFSGFGLGNGKCVERRGINFFGRIEMSFESVNTKAIPNLYLSL